jgi:carbamate kinase
VSKELRHDRYIVSLLTDYVVFSPKIQAAVEFVEQGGERAVVCRPWTFQAVRQLLPVINKFILF